MVVGAACAFEFGCVSVGCVGGDVCNTGSVTAGWADCDVSDAAGGDGCAGCCAITRRESRRKAVTIPFIVRMALNPPCQLDAGSRCQAASALKRISLKSEASCALETSFRRRELMIKTIVHCV